MFFMRKTINIRGVNPCPSIIIISLSENDQLGY